MAIANVTLNNTFDEWRTVTNQVITFVNEVEGGNLTKFYSNSAVLTVTENVSRGGKNYITLNTSSNVLDTSTLNVATANAVNVVFAALANTDARLILVSNDANTINAIANASIIHSNLAFEQANTARVHANASFLAANNFASDVGSAANAYARTIGTAGNSYTQTVGTAGNTYTETVGTAGNNYTRTVGTVGNTYTQTVGAAGNSYAQTVGTAGNNYTISVGTAGNSYTQTVGTAGNNYMITTGVSIGSGANAYAVSIGVGIGSGANAYAQTVGTAGNNYTISVGTAGNSYTRTVGTAGNTYVETVGTAGNNYMITTGVSVGAGANAYAVSIGVGIGSGANAYARTVGTAGNTYVETVGTAGNNYTRTVGTVGNTYAETVGTAGNNYTRTVGIAGNNYTITVGNAGNTFTSQSFDQANTARIHSNNAYSQANLAFELASLASGNNANTLVSNKAAFDHANSAFEQANTARVHANAAFAAANNAVTDFSPAFIQANTARNHANAAFATANIAFANANTVMISAQAAFTVANASFLHANAGFAATNSAFDQANTARVHANTAHASANASYAFGNSAHAIANLAFTHANNAYSVANTANNTAVGNTIANGMYQTRSTRSQINFIETNQIIYNIVDDAAGNRVNVSVNIVGITPVAITANAAFDQANTARIHANTSHVTSNAAFDQANTARVHANTAHASANAGLATANASYAFGNSAHAIANLAFTHANNAYLAANTANNMAVGNTIANGMYQTRSTRSQLNFIETNQIIYNIVDDSAGNRINVSANIVGITPVAITSNAAFLHANAAFATTNANYAFSNSAHSIANLAFTHANNAYAAANALSSGFSNTSGSSFAGNMQIPTGNLTIGDGITQGIRLHVNSWIGIANVFPQVEVMGGSQFIQFNANTNFGGWNDLMLARDISIIYSRGAADDSANLIIGPWTDSSFGYKQDGAGRHGFNTSNPRHVLDANGTANISSTLTVGANIIVRGTSITINGLEVVQNTANQTITNKRVTSRVASTASNSATPTLNTDNTDHFIITGQTVNITSMTTNLSGTPTDGQKLIISMTAASGTPTVAWGATFESSGSVTLPTSISTTRLDIGFLWNAATSKWRCVAAI